MQHDSVQILNLIARTLYQKKGFNIVAIDVRGVSTLTDFFLIAEGSVDRHVISLSRSVEDVLKEQEGLLPLHREGLASGDWVVLDYLEIVIHLFIPSVRDNYRLEEMWSKGKIINLESGIEEIVKR